MKIILEKRNLLVLTLLLMLGSTFGFAQKNIIKARAIYLPADNPTYSFGLGYERVITDNITVQLLYNSSQFTPGFDAETTKSQGFVPEVRYYLGKKDDLRKKLFFAVFTELYTFNKTGGMPQYNLDYSWVESNGNMTSLGVMIGKNNSLGKHFLIDIYFGFRYKFEKGINTFRRTNGELFFKDFKEAIPEARFGLNVGYLF